MAHRVQLLATLLVLALLLCGCPDSPLGRLNETNRGSNAEEYTYDRVVLKGLPGVSVVVEGIREDANREGLTRQKIQSSAVARLRRAGIKTFSTEPFVDPYLYVNVTTYKCGHGGYAFRCLLAVQEVVELDRDPSVSCVADTWQREVAGYADPSRLTETVLKAVTQLTDRFAAEYRAANSRSRTTEL